MKKEKYITFRVTMILMLLLLALGILLLVLGLNMGGDRIILPAKNAL